MHEAGRLTLKKAKAGNPWQKYFRNGIWLLMRIRSDTIFKEKSLMVNSYSMFPPPLWGRGRVGVIGRSIKNFTILQEIYQKTDNRMAESLPFIYLATVMSKTISARSKIQKTTAFVGDYIVEVIVCFDKKLINIARGLRKRPGQHTV